MATTSIEWTDAVWNPVTGCTPISPGCAHCYAQRMHKRLQGIGMSHYQNDFSKVVCHEDALGVPSKWKKPRMVFVNSMSDLFHDDVPLSFIEKVFDSIRLCPTKHVFQILTKRAYRAYDVCSYLRLPPHVWLGVSVENQDCVDRVKWLADTSKGWPSNVKFLSIEPLLGPVDVDLFDIDWVIVGGESGPSARPMKPEWVRSIRDKCVETRVPFFFKQWGGVHKKENGCLLDGREWKEMPIGAL